MMLFTLTFLGCLVSSYCVDVGKELTASYWLSASCSLQLKDGTHKCGCTVISDQWLLTSGYCAGMFMVDDVQVALGSIDLKNPKIIKNVEELIHHEDYHLDHHHNFNDIGLIKLDSKVKFDFDIRPWPTLDAANEALMWKQCKIVGWGKSPDPNVCTDVERCIKDNINRDRCQLSNYFKEVCKRVCYDYHPECSDLNHDIIREGDVTVLPNVLSSLYYDQETITKNVASVLDRANKVTTSTKLDAGGPLFCKSEGVWYQVGISSYMEKNPDPNVIQIYTIVARYADWIKSKTGFY